MSFETMRTTHIIILKIQNNSTWCERKGPKSTISNISLKYTILFGLVGVLTAIIDGQFENPKTIPRFNMFTRFVLKLYTPRRLFF